MIRLPLLCLTTVLSATLALAALPCKTKDEAMAEAVVGFFLVQRIAAERCDEHLGGESIRGLHRDVEARFVAERKKAGTVRADWFRRAYGDKAEEWMGSVDAVMTDLLGAQLLVNDETCAGLKSELQRRLAGGWKPIWDRLMRKVEAVPDHDASRCKE